MKILLNKCYGYFCFNDTDTKLLDDIRNVAEKNVSWDSLAFRTNKDIIRIVEEYTEKSFNINGDCSNIKVVEIPDRNSLTDFIIQNYDGYENCIYVLNGKLYSDEKGKINKE